MTTRSRLLARRLAVPLTAVALAVTAFAPSAAADPTWLPVEELSSGTPFDAVPEVAVGTNGTAVAVWGRVTDAGYSVQAARKTPGGAWSDGVTLSSTDSSGLIPHAVVDGSGNASVIWASENGTGPVRAAHRAAGGSGWTAQVTLAPTGGQADLAVDHNGNLLATWTRDNKIYVARKAAGGSWTTPAVISGSSNAQSPQVAVDGSGNATAVWMSFDGADYDVRSARRPAGQPWGVAVTIAGSNDDETSPELTVDHAGNAVAAWDHVTGGVQRVEGAYRQAGQNWSVPAFVSPESEPSSVADIDIDESGNVLALWTGDVGGKNAARVSTLLPNGTWAAPVTLSEAGVSTTANNVTLDKFGNAAVGMDKETDTGGVAQVVRKPAGGSWDAPMALPTVDPDSTSSYVKHDNQGNLTAVWSSEVNPIDTTIQSRTLDAAGPTSTITNPVASRQTATSFTTAWTATDRWSDIGTADVRYRVAPWNGDFGSHTDWKAATPDSSAVLAGSAGNSYCFSARARDVVANVGPWSAERCTATPLDDYRLSRVGTWNRGTSADYYEGTYTSTKNNGAALIRTGVKAKHIALLATKCANCGQVKVFLNGTSLGTFNLYRSSTARKQLISVKTFTTDQTGTLKIQVVSPTGKTVYMDGVVLRAF